MLSQLRESMGIAADGSNKAFPSKDVDAFLERDRAEIPVDIMSELSRYNTRHFVLAGMCFPCTSVSSVN